jgi:hypothetical protein
LVRSIRSDVEMKAGDIGGERDKSIGTLRA